MKDIFWNITWKIKNEYADNEKVQKVKRNFKLNQN